jgi:hypothetical protein
MPETGPQIADQAPPKRRSGNPNWIKGGPSPNPSGNSRAARAARQSRRDSLAVKIAADLAGGIEKLTFTDKLLLDRAVDLQVSWPRSSEGRLRATNTASRLLENLRRQYAKSRTRTPTHNGPRQVPVPIGALGEYVAATYGGGVS